MSGSALLTAAAALLVLGAIAASGAQTVDSPGAAATPATPASDAADPARLLVAQNRLAFSLIERLGKHKAHEEPPQENIVVSPASVGMALAILEGGADEKLRIAIHQTLGFAKAQAAPSAQPTTSPAKGKKAPAKKGPAPAAGAKEAAADLRALLTLADKLQSDKGVADAFTLANAIVFDPKSEPYEIAVQGLKQRGVEVSVEDLSTPATLKAINDWVFAKTNGLIPTILEEPPSRGGLIALNALYFKDKWEIAFDVSRTETAPFHAVSGEIQVQIMRHPGIGVPVRTNDKFVAVELPYAHERFSLVLVTTKEKPARLAEFAPVAEWMAGDGFARQTVEVAMPRFELSGRAELLGPLDALGLRDGRHSRTALRGFSPVQLTISQIVQKTFLRVNEEGTEAAAVTALHATRGAAPRVDKITFDKPFLFALRDKTSGLVLMAGYVGHP